MDNITCRACRGQAGAIVLDLGNQPACDLFPDCADPGPDPVHALQMWLCSACGLAQLAADPTMPAEPRGAEPAALVAQARDAVTRVQAAGMLPEGATVAEYGSPHGGSWLGLAADRGLKPVADDERADVIVDCFGMMHAADQHAALSERAARLAPGGTLLLQYHSLETIIRETPCGTATTPTTPPRRLRACWPCMACGPAPHGSSSSTAAPSCSRSSMPPTRPGARTQLFADCWTLRPRLACAILSCSRGCTTRCSGTPAASATGSARSDPRAARCSATAPRPAPSPCSARRGSPVRCCPASSMPRRPRADCECRVPTYPCSARRHSSPASQTPSCCSWRTC